MKATTTDVKPIAMIVDTQLGAGRKSLLNYTAHLSSKRRFYEIDPDQLLGNPDHLINFFSGRRYDTATNQYVRCNIILHQDLTDLKAVEQTIAKFHGAGYTVGVRALAVSALDNKMAQIEALDIGRFVSTADQDTAFRVLPQAVNYLEENGKYDLIEIFKRGSDKRDSAPELVYAKFNPDTKAKTLDALADCENVSHRNHNYRFNSAQAAMDKTRRLETIRCAPTIPERMRAVEPSAVTNPVLHNNLEALKTRLADYQQSCKLTKCIVHAKATAKRIDDTERVL